MNVWRIGSNWGGKSGESLKDSFKRTSVVFAGDEVDHLMKRVVVGDVICITDGQPIIAIGTIDRIADLSLMDGEQFEKKGSRIAFLLKDVFWGDFGKYDGQGSQFHQAQGDYPRMIIEQYEKAKGQAMISSVLKTLQYKKQVILQGAPGTGKTYRTMELAVRLIHHGRTFNSRSEMKQQYDADLKAGKIGFTTFHQSMDYEEFVEGYKPEQSTNGEPIFKLKDGIFKVMCKASLGNSTANTFDEKYQEFIDEISDSGEPLELETPRHKKKFTCRVNSAQSLVATPRTEIQTEMSVTKEMLSNYVFDGKIRDWKSYVIPIGEYFKNKYGPFDNKLSGNIKPHVLIIDEINRGNVAKIFGELITLIEADKRTDLSNPSNNNSSIQVKLTYSGEPFTIPSNLYIIGTMNTADRSVGQIDYALRRRFAFITLPSSKSDLESFYEGKDAALKSRALNLFDRVYAFIKERINAEFNVEDLMVGHSYFMASSPEELIVKIDYEIKPLIQEYYKDGIIRNLDKMNELFTGI